MSGLSVVFIAGRCIYSCERMQKILLTGSQRLQHCLTASDIASVGYFRAELSLRHAHAVDDYESRIFALDSDFYLKTDEVSDFLNDYFSIYRDLPQILPANLRL